MKSTQTSEVIDQSRRRLLGTAALALAASELAAVGPANAAVPALRPGSNTSFATLKQIDAGLLNVGYAEAGPASGPPVILLHGWPYDIYSFVDVAPLLASAGYRVIVPYVRGCGTTRFLSGATLGTDSRRRRCRCHRLHGCPQDRQGDPRRFRLGRADGQHRRSALAGALQGARHRQRL